jgi:dethiobiotin synthetase
MHYRARRLVLPYHRSSWRSSASSSSSTNQIVVSIPPSAMTHFIFGANTDVGKTVISAGLVQASLRALSDHHRHHTVNYIKPLQCGGSDASFVQNHCHNLKLQTKTLFTWDTPASPHVASVTENKPVSDDQVISALQAALKEWALPHTTTTWIETAGGVLSPSAASPDNHQRHHALTSYNKAKKGWGWQTQADLYQPWRHQAPVILCGDGRLGGTCRTY